MNPFDLPGPAFLLFYFVISFLVLVLLHLRTESRAAENIDTVKALATRVAQDPYLIASVRGGRNELIQTALVALLERGLLEVKDNKLQAVAGAAEKARRPLDRAILGLYKEPGKGNIAFEDSIVLSEVTKVREKLSEIRLQGQKAETNFAAIGAVCFLWAVALTKIVIALARGHSNVLFLFIMAIVAAIAVVWVTFDNTDARVLDEVRERFASLGNRSSSLRFNGPTGEFAFYAAVFGLTGLSPEIASFVKQLDIAPPTPPAGSSSSGSSCSSYSSGSSCGSGGGCGGCS